MAPPTANVGVHRRSRERPLATTEPTEAIRVPASPDVEESRSTGPPPVAEGRARARRVARLVVVVAALFAGVAAVVLAAMVPGAPVESSTSTVTWPRAGEAPEPTTLLLVPYRPATLEVVVPCRAVTAARERTGATTILATVLGGPAEGLAVRTTPTDGGSGPPAVDVLASGRRVPVAVPDRDCALAIRSDADGVSVTVGDPARPPTVTVPGVAVPEVFAATTDLRGDDAAGLSLRARTPAWFDNAPTPEKTGLVTAAHQLAAIALVLVVLARLLTPSPAPARSLTELAGRRGLAVLRTRARRGRRRARDALHLRTAARLAVDVVVTLTLVWWSIVGPLTDDDGFATVIARQAGTGDVSNYYRWFDASEVPFASGQRWLAAFLDDGASPVALRTPSVLAGLALWLVLTRGVLGPALGATGRSVGVRAVAALALLVWWLPFDLGARPEPLVALGTTTVVALVLRAVRPAPDDGRRPVTHPAALLALAALAAALTVSVAPSGLLAAAPFLLCAPRVVRAIGGAGTPREAGRAARATRAVLPIAHSAVIVGVAATVVTLVFDRQSWHGFLVATDIHQQLGPSQPWYAEWLRYGYLFGDDSWGAAAKRVPVLLGMLLAGTGLAVLARGRRPVELVGRESVLLLGLAPTGFVLLAVTPSKWSHHFGALAGYGAIGLVVTVVALRRAVPARDPVLAGICGVATVGLVLGAAFAFSGPNAWWGYSGFGMPGADGPQRPFDSPLLWGGVAVLGAAGAAVVALAGRRPGTDRRRMLLVAAPTVPVVVALAVAVTSTLLLVSTFRTAGDRPGYSLAAQNRAALGDPSATSACGLQDRVEVLQSRNGPLQPVDGSTATMTGFVTGGGAVDPPPVRPGQTDGTDGTPDTRDGRFTWGSRADGDGSVGTLTTGWFRLPALRPGQELATGVAGRTSDGTSLTWQFGDGDRQIGSRPVVETPEPDRGYRGYAADPEQERLQDRANPQVGWRTLTLGPSAVPDGADRVRLVAVDDRTDDDGWIALTGPRIVDVVPLDRWLAGRSPVLVDWSIAFAWPCTGPLPRVAGGLAQTPGVFITAPTGPTDPLPGERIAAVGPIGDLLPQRWTLGADGLTTGRDSGGSFAGVPADGSLRELDTRLPDEPGRRWGRVLVPDLEDLTVDRYDVARTTVVVPGTAGDPPPDVGGRVSVP